MPPLPAAVETAAYRITTEALHNVAKHSNARACVVRIDHDGAQLRLSIEDDGRGLADQSAAGLGLATMRERAEELGGTLVVTSWSGRSGNARRRRSCPARPRRSTSTLGWTGRR